MTCSREGKGATAAACAVDAALSRVRRDDHNAARHRSAAAAHTAQQSGETAAAERDGHAENAAMRTAAASIG